MIATEAKYFISKEKHYQTLETDGIMQNGQKKCFSCDPSDFGSAKNAVCDSSNHGILAPYHARYLRFWWSANTIPIIT